MMRRFRTYLAHLLAELAIWVLPPGRTFPQKTDCYKIKPVYPEGWGPQDDPCGFASGE